jgi:hypothetical protein
MKRELPGKPPSSQVTWLLNNSAIDHRSIIHEDDN